MSIGYCSSCQIYFFLSHSDYHDLVIQNQTFIWWFNIMNQGPQNYGSADLKDSDRETALSRHQINLTWNDCGDLNNLSNLEWRCWISVWVNTCGPGDPLLSDPPIYPLCNSSSFTLTMFTFGVFGLTIPM